MNTEPTSGISKAETLRRLAVNRKRRIQPNGRPRFNLTRQEIQQSTRTAMELARAK